MQNILMLKILPDPGQRNILLETMEVFNVACNDISRTAFKNDFPNKYELHKLVYYGIKEKYRLPSQLVVRAISKVAESYKVDRTCIHEFDRHGSIIYDQRILSFKGLDTVSMNTLHGRIRMPIIFGEYQKQKLSRVHGQADLIYRNNAFYLAVVVDLPEEPGYEPIGYIGVDIGVKNIATTSDKKNYAGDLINQKRIAISKHRSRLQKKGTRSAKRRLRKISGKEKRFQRNINHNISKGIVVEAKGTGRGVALEDLSNINQRTVVRKKQRYIRLSWAFRQLRSYIEYKAKASGVPIKMVDPRNTSRECPDCHAIDKGNRKDRDTFKCVRCGYGGEADYVASLNIRSRAAVNQPIVA
ncbi:MAG: RNA-guided endonuclease InsQ/TnpB family protein [Thermoplasmata archaeon]